MGVERSDEERRGKFKEGFSDRRLFTSAERLSEVVGGPRRKNGVFRRGEAGGALAHITARNNF